MKIRLIPRFITTGLMATVLLFTLGLYSCGDDKEDIPEVATNETAYNIVGHVYEGSNPLSGVNVTLPDGTSTSTKDDGYFELSVASKGAYAVTFSKDGYIKVAGQVAIPTDAENKSSVVINQLLTARNPSVQVGVDGMELWDQQTQESGIIIPANALSENTEISVTEYVEGQVLDDINAYLATVNLEPDGLTFDKEATLKFRNPLGSEVHFSDNGMEHLYKSSGATAWTSASVAPTYVPAENVYSAPISGFSDHAFSIPAEVTSSVGTVALNNITLDNIGNYSVLQSSISLEQRSGWDIDGNISNIISAQVTGVSSETINNLVAAITDVISSSMGSQPGVNSFTLNSTLNIDGDSRMTISVIADVYNRTFAFPITKADGTNITLRVSVTQYIGTHIYYTSTNGTDHSGGAGS
jgi:hypothetical protein